MSDGVLTRALADLARAGIPLTAALDPARRDDILRAPGIGLKAYDRLQETAAIAADLQAAPKRARGGAGRGQGRKPIKQGEDTVTVSLRMAIGQRAKLKRLGGGAWFRSQIDAAVEP
jgi:hypothetical protein